MKYGNVVAIVLVGMAIIVFLEVGSLIGASMNAGYAPDQPIPFSHKIHAGDNKMECFYCHHNVDKSNHASVPPTSLCMGCHKTVAKESPHIQKLAKLDASGGSFEWIKIHNLPEHVRFPHKRHIAAGVQCQTCHGPVETMDTVKQEHNFTMGWCLSCHRDNNYVDSELQVGWRSYAVHHAATIKIGESGRYDDVVKAMPLPKIHPFSHINAPTECSTCHR